MRMTATPNWPRRLLLAAMVSTALSPGAALAQEFPSRPVNILVGFGAGGALDVYSRKIAEAMSRTLGQQVVVVNRPGANGDVSLSAGAKAPPDGHTIVAIGKYFTSNVHLQKSDYEPLRDFAPLTMTATYPMVLSVNMNHPARTAAEFFAIARGKPGAVNFGVAGAPGKMAMAQLAQLAGVQFTEIPYNSDPQMLTDFMAGRVDAMMTASPTAITRIKNNQMRPLGVTSTGRFPALPDIPSLSEVVPGYSDGFWLGFVAPAGTPAPIVQRLYQEIRKASADPEVDKWLRETAGMEPASLDPPQFLEFLKKDLILNEKVVRENKIAVN
jgi:tripartite-type tricarboxylate transporter receptor subunit TctC